MLWYAVDFVACYCYIGVYISPDKAISIFSYTMNVSKYSITFISDHLHKKTIFVLQYFVFLLVEQWCSNTATLYANPKMFLLIETGM